MPSGVFEVISLFAWNQENDLKVKVRYCYRNNDTCRGSLKRRYQHVRIRKNTGCGDKMLLAIHEYGVR